MDWLIQALTRSKNDTRSGKMQAVQRRLGKERFRTSQYSTLKTERVKIIMQILLGSIEIIYYLKSFRLG